MTFESMTQLEIAFVLIAATVAGAIVIEVRALIIDAWEHYLIYKAMHRSAPTYLAPDSKGCKGYCCNAKSKNENQFHGAISYAPHDVTTRV